MPIINLKQQYPHLYDEILLEISDPIFEVYERARKDENNYNRRRRYHHACYSLDAGDNIETLALHRPLSPEEIIMQKISKEQLQEALNHLSPIQSRRVYAHYMLGMTKTAIARKEGTTKGSVACAIQAGLKNLKKSYEKHYYEKHFGED